MRADATPPGGEVFETAMPSPIVRTGPLLPMLVMAYAANFMDRTIIGTLAQAIKVDLVITDGQLGLLQGFAFVVLYSFTGLWIANLTERFDRIWIISVCITLWSGMTMLCGTAANFAQLLLFRIGVGIGEAGCNAPSHSMIADAYEPRRRASALGIYNMGTAIGTMIGAMSGGLIAQYLGWREAFLIVGAPGVVLAIAMRLILRDPPRTAIKRDVPVTPVRIAHIAKGLAGNPAIRHMVFGFTLTSFAAAGSGSFAQPYFIRNFGLTYAQIGLIFGLAIGLSTAISMVVSGRLADRTSSRDGRWHAWLPAIGVAVSTPFSLMAYSVGSWPLALALLIVADFFATWFIAPTLSGIHKIVGPRAVAMSMALILLFQNMLGLGGGPLVTGMLIDHFAQSNFAQLGLGEFLTACPGGVAPAGSAADLVSGCASSLAGATRWGIYVAIVMRIWAVLHFVLAARHVARALGAGASGEAPGLVSASPGRP